MTLLTFLGRRSRRVGRWHGPEVRAAGGSGRRQGRSSIAERIWDFDATLWTDSGEDRWLGWLDVVTRTRSHIGELNGFAEAATEEFHECILLGMGGSSLAPEVLRRAFAVESFHVLDTTHPAAIRRLEHEVDLEQTLFLVSSKSGSTIETRSHLEYFWERCGGHGEQFAAITDPGSELERLAHERGFRATFAGEPEIGGRYSALSLFGIVPAALMGVDLERFLQIAAEMTVACHEEDGNPGVELGLRLGNEWEAGRDKVCLDESSTGFGLWAEQLLAESTGKLGKGLVPAPGEPADGPDRQRGEIDVVDPYDLGAEWYRWEFATTVAGHVLGINPFDQPDVQAAKDKTSEVLAAGEPDVRRLRDLSRICSGRQPRATTSGLRRSWIPPASRSSHRSSSAGAKPAASSPRGSAPAICTRPGSCTRAARTRASSSRWSTRRATRSRFPDVTSGSAA